MQHETRLHRCLDESRLACGIFFGLSSPALLELVVHGTNLDFVGVELQHSPVGAADLVHLLRALQAADPLVTPLVRLPNHDVYWIQQSLDAGYAGLIVPLVESAEQARRLVRAAYFPPTGARSTAGSIRASMYGIEPTRANDRMILLPQIESAEGLGRIQEIVAVKGVTGVLLGPEDLSLSCGWLGKDLWSHGPFLEAVARVVAACKEHNKVPAILTGGFQQARESGFRIIGFGSDSAEVRVNMTSTINEKLRVLRQGDTSLSSSSGSAAGARDDRERIEAYRASLARFDRWIEKNLEADRSQPASADGYFSLIPYANYVGRRDLALRLLWQVEERFVTRDGPLQQNANREQMITYVPSWLAWGACDAEAFHLSGLWLDYVCSFQDQGSGGFFAGAQQRDKGSGTIDFDSTTMATIALARAGRVVPCVKGGRFLLSLCQRQPAPEEQFFTAWNEPGGLLTEAEEGAKTTVLRWTEPKQHYYKMGLLVVALAQVYGATGERTYLDAATRLYNNTIVRAADLWTNTLSHKMCWAATTLYTLTREPDCLHHACRFADHLVGLQQQDGAFTYPEVWPAYPPQRWELIPNVSAQFGLWIARVLRTLEA